MKSLLRCCCAFFALLLVISLAGCKEKELRLVGTYSINDQGKMEPYVRIEKKGNDYWMTGNHGGKWGSSIVVTPVSKEELSRVLKGPVSINFAGLGNNNVAIFQVPKGWKLDKFECKTGFVLATVIGPLELYKN